LSGLPAGGTNQNSTDAVNARLRIASRCAIDCIHVAPLCPAIHHTEPEVPRLNAWSIGEYRLGRVRWRRGFGSK
jgi:hypothetical protein